MKMRLGATPRAGIVATMESDSPATPLSLAVDVPVMLRGDHRNALRAAERARKHGEVDR